MNSSHDIAPESSAGPVPSTLPLIILVLRGLKREWRGGESSSRPIAPPRGAGVPFLAAAAVDASAAVTGSEEGEREGKGELVVVERGVK